MLRSIAVAACLLLALVWTMTTWVEAANSATPFHIRGKAPGKAALGITAGDAITGGTLITVTTTADELNNDGDCSLREAIQAANRDSIIDNCPAGQESDTIFLPAGVYSIAMGLLLGKLYLEGNITLQGSTNGSSILVAQYGRVLTIGYAANATLSWLDIRNGRGDYLELGTANGGGIVNYGTTVIANSVIHHNIAGTEWLVQPFTENGGNGGGVYNAGILTVLNSTISDNEVGSGYDRRSPHDPPGGPCPHNGEGGGIANTGTLTIENSTIVNNRTGSGFYGFCGINPGEVGGIFNSGSGEVIIKNSIIANNSGNDCGGQITSLGHNILGTSSNCTISGNFVHWSAYLGPLQDNGGPTLTHALETGSPAIDAGDCTDSTDITVTVDQRGEPRPQGEGCDIGAYESPYTSTFEIRDTSLPLIRR